MTLVRLFNAGFITTEGQAVDNIESIPNQLTRRARLVYEGEFESLDGPVKVTSDHLEKICQSYNGRLAKLKRLALGPVGVAHMPPVQLDHTRSARDTVGRLENADLVVEDWTDEDGKTRKALYGNVRFLGRENVEKVLDGRWSTLSVGADFDSGKLDELSVTPFPAAERATLLARSRLSKQTVYEESDADGHRLEVIVDTVTGVYTAMVDGAAIGDYASEGAARTACKEKARASIQNVKLGYRENFVTEVEWNGIEATVYKEGKNRYYLQANNYRGGGGFDESFTATSDAEAERKAVEILKKASRLTRAQLANGEKGYVEVTIDGGRKMRYSFDEFRKITKSSANSFIDEVVSRYNNAGGQARIVWTLSHIDKDSIMKLALYQRLRRHLKKKMSDEEVDEKMNKLSEEEDEEELKKLAEEMDEEEKKELAESEEKDSDEHKEKMKKMSTARENIARLASDFRARKESAQLAAKAAEIGSRLSAIRASGRITPAEVKKIDIKQLASKSKEAIDAVLKSYEDRQPVILVGQLGSMKPMSLKEIEKAGKTARLTRLELETRKNMSLLKNTVSEKLAEGEQEGSTDTVNVHIDTDPHTDLAGMDSDYTDMCRMMDEGKIAEAKERLKGWFDRMKKMGAYGMAEPTMHETSMSQLAALQADIEHLSKQFDEAMGLASSLADGDTK